MARRKRFTVEAIAPKVLAFARETGGLTLMELAKVLKRTDQRAAQIVAALEEAKALRVVGTRSGNRGKRPKLYGLVAAKNVGTVPVPAAKAPPAKAKAVRARKPAATRSAPMEVAASDPQLLEAVAAIADSLGRLVALITSQGLSITQTRTLQAAQDDAIPIPFVLPGKAPGSPRVRGRSGPGGTSPARRIGMR
jgi:hypothetical protein